MAHNKTDDVLPTTAVRSRLFELIEEILTGVRSRLEVSHRSFDEHVVLVRKGHLEALDADLAALRARIGIEARPLRGFGTLHGDLDQFLADSRARQAELVRRKRASLSSDEPSET
jgi:hypothetical protein